MQREVMRPGALPDSPVFGPRKIREKRFTKRCAAKKFLPPLDLGSKFDSLQAMITEKAMR